MPARITSFGTRSDGHPVSAIHLDSGVLRATILTQGAILQDLRLAGTPWPLTLGCDRIEAYESMMGYYGAIVGPVANRIAGAEAEIGRTRHRFAANEGANLLHGGDTGTHAQSWTVIEGGTDSVRLGLTLPDGLGGFPGTRRITADYRLEGATLELCLSAQTDAPGLMNLAHHGYWNLDGSDTIEGHVLRVDADRYLAVDDQTLPLADPVPASGVFDLRAGRRLTLAEGFDHNFCLSDSALNAPRAVAELIGRKGVRMTIETTEPGLQVYDGRGIDTAPYPGHQGQPYRPWAGIALEPQRWPDAARHARFPSIAITPDRPYRQISRFVFARGD